MDDVLESDFDVIVVGTGPGGASLGWRLASQGRRVLFCERGGESTASVPPLMGRYPELAELGNGSPPDPDRLHPTARELLDRAGRCSDVLLDASNGRRAFVPFIGSGPGGSSLLYGMAMERMRPSDFEPEQLRTRGGAGTSAVGAWPITYAELAPYYALAERLYEVRGELDPLMELPAGLSPDHRPQLLDPPPLTRAMAELSEFLVQRGMHPYRIPMACRYLPGCASCQGVRCRRACKVDAWNVSVEPAIRNHGAKLLTGCRVLDVTSTAHTATGVKVAWRGQLRTLRAKLIVLAAGALQSPLILLRSGLGNAHDQVGRNLMRHFIDIVQVKPASESTVHPSDFDNRRKEIAFNDFYDRDGVRLGTVQSFGRLPPVPMLFESLRDDLRGSRLSPLAALLPLARPFVDPILRDIETGNLSLAAIVEDLPYAEHRVLPVPGDPSKAELHYSMKNEAVERVKLMRQRLKGVLRGRKTRLLPQADNNHRIAHVCGTCRFGDDPRTSVLDRNNRVHGVEGLYVVDASFFPTSGGTNPTLTIVANALRVADHIHAAC